MILRFEQLLEKIKRIDADISELKRLRSRIPSNRTFTPNLQVAFDKSINDLLSEKISLEELEIENPPEDLISEIVSVDVATASRMRSSAEATTLEPTAQEANLIEFLKHMPKTEIHLHMEACISRDTLIGMLEKNHIDYQKEDVEKLYKFKNLQEFINLFLFILNSVKSPDDFELIFANLRQYLENNHIRYAEVFLAPSKLIQNGLDFNEIIQTIEKYAGICRREGGPDVKLLIDVSRTFGPENASRNLQRVIQAKSNIIAGIGLGGAELMGPARDYKNVFAQARSEGLFTVAHAGEDDGPWSIRDTVEVLRAQRIGHGTSAIQDPSLMEIIKKKEIPIEICLTSNVFTGKYVRREKDHPVRRYYDEGLICSVNTDDPEIFNVSITDEYYKFYKFLNFTVSEITDLVRQGIYASFHPDPSGLWNEARKQIEQLRAHYHV